MTKKEIFEEYKRQLQKKQDEYAEALEYVKDLEIDCLVLDRSVRHALKDWSKENE